MNAYKCDVCGSYDDKSLNFIRVYGHRAGYSIWGNRLEMCDKCFIKMIKFLGYKGYKFKSRRKKVIKNEKRQ